MIKKIAVSLALATLSTGCAMSASVPVTGFVYNGSQGATAATANDVGTKVGESCATSYVGVIGLGDASIASAAKAGGISKISSVDSKSTSILGLYAKNCTVVSGK